MREIRLAHFDHHWEAELARGYLEDAGLPSRLVSDNLAGGHAYVGSVAGASLLVGSDHLEEAREVLSRAGMLSGAASDPASGRRGADRAPARRPLEPVQRADLADLTEELKAARRAEVRHFIRCMLGITPAAVIPAVGLVLEGNVALLALLCVLVSLVEGRNWIRAGRVTKRLQEELERMEEGPTTS
jgi:hypothetical protein